MARLAFPFPLVLAYPFLLSRLLLQLLHVTIGHLGIVHATDFILSMRHIGLAALVRASHTANRTET